jgi:hypothetical protein
MANMPGRGTTDLVSDSIDKVLLSLVMDFDARRCRFETVASQFWTTVRNVHK